MLFFSGLMCRDGCRGDRSRSPLQASAVRRDRIQFLDALRGLSIILVVAYHCGFNLVAMGYIPRGALYNPLLDVLQPLFAGLFIVLAGISSRFSQNNLKRGLFVVGAAALVTVVSLVIGMPIWFGILHLLAACILLYLLVGCVGFPVFSGGKAGWAVLFGPTGGYLFGFVLSAMLCGWGTKKLAASRHAIFSLCATASVLTLFCGSLQLKILLDFSLDQACLVGLLPFLPGDLIKSAAATGIFLFLKKNRLVPH